MYVIYDIIQTTIHHDLIIYYSEVSDTAQYVLDYVINHVHVVRYRMFLSLSQSPLLSGIAGSLSLNWVT